MDSPSSPDFSIRSNVARYVFGILLGAAALMLRELLTPWLGKSAPYLTLWTAVVFSSWYLGVGPSIAAAVTGVAGVWLLFFRSLHSLSLRNPQTEIPGMIGFVIFSGFIIALGEANRRARTKLDSEIEERRQLMAESVAASAKFRAVFEQTSVFAGIVAVDGTLIDANQLSVAHCGYRAEQVLGRKFWETPWWRHSPESQEKIRTATIRAARGESYRETLTYYWADDSKHLIDFVMHPIQDVRGRVMFLHPTGVDITELTRNEEDLRKAHDELEQRVKERTGELAESVVSLETEMLVRQQMEQDLRMLSSRLLRMQDEERRRIARDLHDTTGQTLAALKISLATLERYIAPAPGAHDALTGVQGLANQAIQEIRTTSYLLHPPLLDEVGFSSAAQWYIDGFTNRSGVKANLFLSPTPPLTKECELVLFRVLQESLTNVLRHSGSATVDIHLTADAENAVLTVRDYGQGIPAAKLGNFLKTGTGVGVGLGGMKQRLRELGGHLRVECPSPGTCVIASVPIFEVQSGTETPSNLAIPSASSPQASDSSPAPIDGEASPIRTRRNPAA